MPSEQVTLDPTSEDAANAQVLLEDRSNGITLISHDYPDPGPNYMGASSADTEGSIPVQNQPQDRTITAVVRCSGANMRARVKELQKKVGKLNREHGTYKRTLAAGTVIVFDVKSASIDVPADWQFLHQASVQVTMKFLCAPFGRGEETYLGTVFAGTAPCAVLTVTGVKGDVPGLGRLVLTDLQVQDQQFFMWGLESRYYPGTATADTTAALLYEAETRLVYGGASLRALSGASGGTVVQGTVTTSYQAFVSTTSAGTAYCSHVGDFNVWARVRDHGGTVGATGGTVGNVSFALEWSQGDFLRATRNADVTAPSISDFCLVNLGQVHLQEATQGAQRWEGRVLAKGTDSSQAMSIDGIYLQPVAEGSGEARGLVQSQSPTALSVRDEFNQSAGALTGKTLPVGGTWAGAGDADDFTVETTGHTAQRTAISDVDGNTGRYVIADATTLTNTLVQTDFKFSAETNALRQGLLARYTDTNNWMMCVFVPQSAPSPHRLMVLGRVGGGVAVGYLDTDLPFRLATNTWSTLRLVVTTSGAFTVFLNGQAVGRGSSSALATGGALASGKLGIYDVQTDSSANTRNYDNFIAAVAIPDAAYFATQSAEIRHDRAIRADSTGTTWTRISAYEGSYLMVPPAGNEGRSARLMARTSRNDPATMADPHIDNVEVVLYVTPRWLQVPEP